jgi:outer membrane lipoprotein-sorting protein
VGCSALAAVLSFSSPASAEEPAGAVAAAESLIASAVAVYESAGDYEIDFTQESYWALADSTQVTEGTLSVAPPRRMAIRYEDGGRIVVNGESLRVYVPATNQFFATRLDSTDVLFDPVRMLSSYEPDAREPFVRLGSDAGEKAGRRVVRLRPRPPTVEPVRLDVEIDRFTDTVRALAARSSAGDRTRYLVRQTRLGARIPDSAFRLTPPPGAEIVRGTPFGG